MHADAKGACQEASRERCQPGVGSADASQLEALIVTGSADSSIATSRLNVASGTLEVVRRARLGSENGVADVQVRSDGRVFAAGGWDGRVRLFHLRSGKPLAVLKYHRATVAGVAFHPRTHTLASASRDRTVALWSLYQQQ